MRKIKVTGEFIYLHSGNVKLTERQARDRAHGVKQVKDDLYEITGPIGFKRGEVFSFDGDIGKGFADDVEETRAPGRPVGTGKKAQTEGQDNA